MKTKEIENFIAEYPDWYLEEDELVAGFEFRDFAAIEKILLRFFDVIKEVNHHPTITFGYNTIEIRTTTHDAAGVVTEKDLSLARKISQIIAS